MAKVSSNGPPQFLSTHPSPTNRQQTLRALAGQMMGYYLDPSPRPVYDFK
jgi:predicted Zn-dependent protease